MGVLRTVLPADPASSLSTAPLSRPRMRPSNRPLIAEPARATPETRDHPGDLWRSLRRSQRSASRRRFGRPRWTAASVKLGVPRASRPRPTTPVDGQDAKQFLPRVCWFFATMFGGDPAATHIGALVGDDKPVRRPFDCRTTFRCGRRRCGPVRLRPRVVMLSPIVLVAQWRRRVVLRSWSSGQRGKHGGRPDLSGARVPIGWSLSRLVGNA